MNALLSSAPRWYPWHWRWPLPALAAWLLCWAAFVGLKSVQEATWGLLLAALLGAGAALAVQGIWRRLIVACGFPASALLLGVAPELPGWAWLLALLPLLLAYPLRAWRDAPFFPTPQTALDGLPEVVGEPAHILDAGCGLGHGLAALRRQFPHADLVGHEWSPLLALLARWRCHDATVQRADLWARSWADYGLVYLFQRPESMARAWAKACADMPGGWLVSLEFAVPGVSATARLAGAEGRPLWVYRVPAQGRRSMAGRSCR